MIIIKLLNIDINKIYPRKNQPRKYFDKKAILELSKSISKHGLLQPIIVSQEEDKYVIIAGERRYQAAKYAKLKTLPCIIKDVNQTKEISLIENIQRENLNPVEEAKAIEEYINHYNIGHQEMSVVLSKSRSFITNRLRLLTLDDYTSNLLTNKIITEGHAKTLLGINNEKKRIELAKKVVEEGLSVRKTENYVKDSKKNLNYENDIHTKEAIDKLIEILGTKVFLKGTEAKGSLVIEYYDKNQMINLIEKLYSLE